MDVTWSAEAIIRYEEVLEELERFSARGAQRLSLAILRAADRIGAFPEIGRVVPEFQAPSVREVFVGRYRLWYVVRANEVEILTLWPAQIPVE